MVTASTGGYCNLPGECICRSGYSGSNCDVGKFYFKLKIDLIDVHVDGDS